MEAINSAETRIYISKSTVIGNLVLFAIFGTALSWALTVLPHEASIGYLMFVVITVFSYCVTIKQVYNLITHKPQIIISVNGIQLPPAELDSWDKIERVKLDTQHRARGGTRTTLQYTVMVKDGTCIYREIDITNFDLNKLQIKDSLNSYRLQFYVHTKKEIYSPPGCND